MKIRIKYELVEYDFHEVFHRILYIGSKPVQLFAPLISKLLKYADVYSYRRCLYMVISMEEEGRAK